MALSSARRGPRAAQRRRFAVLALACALVACTGDDPSSGPPPGSRRPALEVAVVQHAGPLDEEARTLVESGIGDVVSQYVVRAFLGDFPRDDFVPAFEAFTSRAARGAAEDIDFLTASRYQDADSVEAIRLRVRISTLAHRGLVGATAEVDLRFRVTGSSRAREFGLTGRFLLEERDGSWTIFGYDVQRDDVGRATG